MVDVGHTDINTKVSILSSYLDIPRQGHLKAVLHAIGYLKLKHNLQSAYDPSYPNIDHRNFQECDCTDFYESAVKTSHPMLHHLEAEVNLCMFVDSDHACDKQTRRSWTRVIIYMNMSLINWYSKKQSTIETSVFGTEFVAMKVGMDWKMSSADCCIID